LDTVSGQAGFGRVEEYVCFSGSRRGGAVVMVVRANEYVSGTSVWLKSELASGSL